MREFFHKNFEKRGFSEKDGKIDNVLIHKLRLMKATKE